MRHRLAAAALLTLLALGSTGCVLFLDEDLIGFACGPFELSAGPRGFGIDPCSCELLCELGGPGGSLVGQCYAGDDVFGICYSIPLARGPRGAGPTYELPPDAYFALGSYAAGAATSHQIGFSVPPASLETFSAVVTYPSEFVFAGFAPGPVGALGLDLDLDGAVDAEVPVLGLGGDLAFADLDFDGAQLPGIEPTVTHSGTHVFSVALPRGGDRNPATLQSSVSFGMTLTLLPGILDNPPAPGAYLVEADFTSVDPDTDGADDAAGSAPATLATDETVQIGDGPCPPAPAPGCNDTFAKASLALKDGPGDKDSLKIKAKKGATGEGFFGDPTDATSHATCLYDGDALILALPVAAGGTDAGGKPLWKLRKGKATYKDKAAAAGGVTKVGQRSARKGAGFDVAARGAGLGLPPLPVQGPLTVQHRTNGGGCGEIVFTTLQKNDTGQVKAALK